VEAPVQAAENAQMHLVQNQIPGQTARTRRQLLLEQLPAAQL
jgi:hypothetical protein